MNIALGSSWLDVPFAFPNWSVADRMGNRGVKTSSSRATQLVVFYWDGIDGKKIRPLENNGASQKDVINYLASRSVSKNEATAFVGAMLSLEDKQWLAPSWSYTKSIIQTASSTGYNEEEGSKAVPSLIKSIIWPVLGAVLVYGLATQGIPRMLAGRKTKA